MQTRGRKLIALILAFVTVFALTTTGAAASPSFSEYEMADDGRTLVRYLGDSSEIYIPVGVSTIKAGAFPAELADKITSISFPGSIWHVEQGAFPDPMPNLTDVYFRSMFEDWISYFPTDPDDPLHRIACGDGVTRHLLVEPEGFMLYGTVLKGFDSWHTIVEIPLGVVEIAPRAFVSCDWQTGDDVGAPITAVTFPDSVATIGNSAFLCCDKLQTVTMAGSVKTIGEFAFAYCTSLTHIDIPEGVTVIGANAFEGCTNLTSITIPSSVTAIGADAFKGCPNLKNVVLASSAAVVGDNAFTGTPWLEDQAAQSGDDFFIFGTTLEKYRGSDSDVVIPDGVTQVAFDAFEGCDFIKHITLPESIAGLRGIWYEEDQRYAIPESVVTITFPQKGLLAEEVAAYDPVNFYRSFCYLKNLRRFINCPNPGVEKYFALMDVYTETWVNPGSYVTSGSQSERVIQLSNEITAGLTGDYEKAEAICSWVSENIAYDYDYLYNRKNTVALRPEAVLDARLTICQGYSELTRALLQAQGIPVRLLTGQTDDGEGHAWNTAFADGRWITIDTTWGIFDQPLLPFVQRHLIRSETSYRNSSAEKDIPSGWAKEEAWKAISSYVAPYDLQSSYRSAITREEFCRLMVKLVEKSAGQNIDRYIASRGLSVTDPFTDTDTPEVLAAYALGIVQGTSANTFNPSGSITRQEAATMLARTAKVLGLSAGSGIAFSDAKSFASWAGESITFVSSLTDPVTGNKVMNGTGNGRFSPAGTYTREQAFVTAVRLLHCAESR